LYKTTAEPAHGRIIKPTAEPAHGRIIKPTAEVGSPYWFISLSLSSFPLCHFTMLDSPAPISPAVAKRS
jgi:hypothetical protein